MNHAIILVSAISYSTNTTSNIIAVHGTTNVAGNHETFISHSSADPLIKSNNIDNHTAIAAAAETIFSIHCNFRLLIRVSYTLLTIGYQPSIVTYIIATPKSGINNKSNSDTAAKCPNAQKYPQFNTTIAVTIPHIATMPDAPDGIIAAIHIRIIDNAVSIAASESFLTRLT